jgi:hypothetical protein
MDCRIRPPYHPIDSVAGGHHKVKTLDNRCIGVDARFFVGQGFNVAVIGAATGCKQNHDGGKTTKIRFISL